MGSGEKITDLIHRILKKKGEVRVSEVVKATEFSRAYVNRFFRQLRGQGKLVLVGKADQARYVPASKQAVKKAKLGISRVHRILRNTGLSEDRVLAEIKEKTGIYIGLPENISHILDYTFAEMLNNAIEHSGSGRIWVWMERSSGNIYFRVLDRGVGIFKHMMAKRGLATELDAVQDLLKGKQTTDPERHSGEGIFFTSKVADRMAIWGSKKKLLYDNLIGDVFIEDIQPFKGTDVEFWVSRRSTKQLKKVFDEYTGEAFEFGKTVVSVELFKTGGSYVSRSQARRILTGLEKFKEVVLDFKKVNAVGQGFADEVFRVWQRDHPHIRLSVRKANENIQFMIKHVSGS
jgi:anti-sigma regulatory factor (Ser/Thr protein kinase)